MIIASIAMWPYFTAKRQSCLCLNQIDDRTKYFGLYGQNMDKLCLVVLVSVTSCFCFCFCFSLCLLNYRQESLPLNFAILVISRI